MLERSQNSYPILRQFREFYGEVARVRQVVEERKPGEVPLHLRLPSPMHRRSGPPAYRSPPEAADVSGAAAAGRREEITPSDENWDQITTRRVWSEMALYLDQKMYEVKLAAGSLSHDLQAGAGIFNGGVCGRDVRLPFGLAGEGLLA